MKTMTMNALCECAKQNANWEPSSDKDLPPRSLIAELGETRVSWTPNIGKLSMIEIKEWLAEENLSFSRWASEDAVREINHHARALAKKGYTVICPEGFVVDGPDAYPNAKAERYPWARCQEKDKVKFSASPRTASIPADTGSA